MSLIEDENITADLPRHGLNAKALLMQAAALAAEEAANMEENAPSTLSAHEQELAHLKSAFATSSKLLTGIPKRETPIVAFVNQTKCRSLEPRGSWCCKSWLVNTWLWL